MERKFKEGDRVWDKKRKKVFTFLAYHLLDPTLVALNEDLVKEFKDWDKDKGTCTEIKHYDNTPLSDIELYDNQGNADLRYKEGDEVWHITEKRRYLFYCYTGTDYCHLSLGVNKYTRSLSDIEPYTGQDKVVAEPEKPTHPFAVILKSGVKIGISSTMFDYINEQDNNTASVQTVEDGSFILSEIAAIVPTENLMS